MLQNDCLPNVAYLLPLANPLLLPKTMTVYSAGHIRSLWDNTLREEKLTSLSVTARGFRRQVAVQHRARASNRDQEIQAELTSDYDILQSQRGVFPGVGE